MVFLQTLWLEITVGLAFVFAVIAFLIYLEKHRKQQEVGLSTEEVERKRALEEMADRL